MFQQMRSGPQAHEHASSSWPQDTTAATASVDQHLATASPAAKAAATAAPSQTRQGRMLTFASASGEAILTSKSKTSLRPATQQAPTPVTSPPKPQKATFAGIAPQGYSSPQPGATAGPSLQQVQQQLQEAAQNLQGVLNAVPHGPQAVLQATQSAAQSSQQTLEQTLQQIMQLQQQLQQQAAAGAPHLMQQAEQVMGRTSGKPSQAPQMGTQPAQATAQPPSASTPAAAGQNQCRHHLSVIKVV